MSKAVLYSIRPEYCKLILDGKKTGEVRKSIPKLDVPFKCYIYETKTPLRWNKAHNNIIGGEGGRVIAEFMCDKIYDITPHFDVPTFPNQYIFEGAQAEDSSCLSFEEINSYLKGNQGYGLHISDLVIYNEPKELSEFTALRKTKFGYEPVEITRPPQSWCYVEELCGA